MIKTGTDIDKDEEDETADGTEKLLTKEDLDRMRQELDEFMHKWKEEPGNLEYGQEIWRKYHFILSPEKRKFSLISIRYEALTSDLAADLCEQLRLILEPTLATKLQGDYRTGKRINMKKVIPYIASQFKKDKVSLDLYSSLFNKDNNLLFL
jgi:midasin